jgi:flagellin
MRINHNISSLVTQSALYTVNRDMRQSLERLSTGLRINRASDDAAGLGVSENLRTQIRGVRQAQRNAQDGISALNIAEGAANEISAILQRMRELAIQSSNDTLTTTERSYIDSEFQDLETEIDRISQVTNYNGQDLISSENARFGSTDNNTLWIDANDTADVDSMTVTLTALDSSDLSINDLNISTQSDAVGAISTLDSAIDTVNSMRANVGAYVNRLEHAVNNLQVSETNQVSAESQIRDVDFASESSRFSRNQILQQSATAMLSQANMVPSGVLTLLQG